MVEKINIRKFCEECRNETEMRFLERDGEYLVYECTVCDSVHEFSEQELENDWEEDVV